MAYRSAPFCDDLELFFKVVRLLQDFSNVNFVQLCSNGQDYQFGSM